MLAIIKNEFRNFFSQLTGYLIAGIFLLVNGLILWVFKGPYNITDNGFADLSGFFLLAPFVLLLLIPAVTMRSIAEERRTGTLELLLIKPLSTWQIVLGKFAGSLILSLLAIIPTLIYNVAINDMKVDGQSLEMGVILGSYLGLFFLIVVYTGIGILASTLASNQVIAFLMAIVICGLLYTGIDALARLFSGDVFLLVRDLGLKSHYDSIARGILSLKDVLYFISITLFALYLSVIRIQTNTKG